VFLSFVPFQILKWMRQHSRETISIKVGRLGRFYPLKRSLVAVKGLGKEDISSAMRAAPITSKHGAPGLSPGKLNPVAVEAMRELGIDISKNKTQAVFE